MIRFKAGVTLAPPTACQSRILSALDRASGQLHHDLTITAGRDGHPLTDPHAKGLAFDVRALDLSEAQILTLHSALTWDLGPEFTVLYEVPSKPNGVLAQIAYVNPAATGAHVHVQLKKGVPADGWL